MKYIKYMCLGVIASIVLTPNQIRAEEQSQSETIIQSQTDTTVQSQTDTTVQSQTDTTVQSETAIEGNETESKVESVNNYDVVEGVLNMEVATTTEPTTTEPTTTEPINNGLLTQVPPSQEEAPQNIEYIPNRNDYVNQDGFWVDANENVQTLPLPDQENNSQPKEPPKIDIEGFNKTQWGIASKGDRVQGAVTSNSSVSLANRVETMNTNVETFSKRKIEFKPQTLKPLTTVTDVGKTPYQHPTPNYTFLITMSAIGGLCLLLSEYYAFVRLRELKREKEESLKEGNGKHVNISLPSEGF